MSFAEYVCLWHMLSSLVVLLSWFYFSRYRVFVLGAPIHAILTLAIFNEYMPAHFNIRVDLVIGIPLTGIIILLSLVTLVLSLYKKPKDYYSRKRMNHAMGKDSEKN